MAWALSMGRIWLRESEFGRASSGPTSLRHRATGSKRTRQTRARPGRQTGCRTLRGFADGLSDAGVPGVAGFWGGATYALAEFLDVIGHRQVGNELDALVAALARDA